MKHIYKHLTLYSLLCIILLSFIVYSLLGVYANDKMKIFNMSYHIENINGEEVYVITRLDAEVEIPSDFENIVFHINGDNNSACSIKVDKKNPNYYSKGNCVIEKNTNKLLMTCYNSIIPNDIKVINCRALTSYSSDQHVSIKYDGTANDWLNIEFELEENFSAIKNPLVDILFNNSGNYEELEYVNIPEGTIKIDSHRFQYFTSIREVVIPSSLKEIGDYAFYGCTKLKKINLNEGLTDVGTHVFAGCTSLENINIPNSLTYLSSQMFWKCTSLKDIELHNNLKKISVQAFYKCPLEEVYVPDSVEIIESSAFDECHSLKKITLPFIGKSRNNTDVANVTVWYIFGGSYYYSQNKPKSLTEIVLYGDAVIREDYFENCKQFKKIYLLDNVKVESDEAFTNYYGNWDCTVYCEVENTPSDWSSNWNQYIENVVWGYKE